jgi:hypothetical protein
MAYGYALRGFLSSISDGVCFYIFFDLIAPPIYTSLSLTGNGMSTVKDVYALIVADMTKAVDGLTTSRLGKSYINKSVANGILAQVYQVMGNCWCKDAANAAYGGDPTAVLNASAYSAGFNDYSNVEWIWGSAQVLTKLLLLLAACRNRPFDCILLSNLY